MVDAADLKSVGRKAVRVRVPPWAPRFQVQVGRLDCHWHERALLSECVDAYSGGLQACFALDPLCSPNPSLGKGALL